MSSNVTIRALSDALLELHRHGNPGGFHSRLFACLKACFFGDFYSYDERMENQAKRIELYPASAVDLDVLSGWIDQRSNIRSVYTHSGPPRILHVCASCRCCSGLHDELLALLGQRHKLRVVILDERFRISVVVSRSAQPFSDEERQMLETLRPHLVQAYKRFVESSFSTEAIGVANVGFLVTDRRGNIRYATIKARELIRRYLHPKSDLTLPDRIQTWLNEAGRPDRAPGLRELTIDFGHISLGVEMMSKPDASHYRLLVRETVQTLATEPLQKLGLTRREAEVLFWASQGKSNGEIAIILASKVRTIAKHLERVFAKLMVENRTAAAHAALATVNRLSS